MLARLTTNLFDATLVIEMDDEGLWSCDGYPGLSRSLNAFCSPGSFGPGDGNPVLRAANKAADLLGGMVEVRPSPPGPPDRVY